MVYLVDQSIYSENHIQEQHCRIVNEYLVCGIYTVLEEMNDTSRELKFTVLIFHKFIFAKLSFYYMWTNSYSKN